MQNLYNRATWSNLCALQSVGTTCRPADHNKPTDCLPLETHAGSAILETLVEKMKVDGYGPRICYIGLGMENLKLRVWRDWESLKVIPDCYKLLHLRQPTIQHEMISYSCDLGA